MMKKEILLVMILTAILITGLSAQNTIGIVPVSKKNPNRATKDIPKSGHFINIKGNNGNESRVFAAGPSNAQAGILFVHDFFGITGATKESVERLGALGYRTIAVDLYKGKSAASNDSAAFLMKAKDSSETAQILQSGIDYLRRPGRKLAAIG